VKPSFEPLGASERIWLSDQTGVDFTTTDMRHWFCVTCRNDQGMIQAVLACEPWNAFEWRFTATIVDPHAITRRLLKTIFNVLFEHARAIRITALVDPGNAAAELAVKRLGFLYEGFLRRGLDGRRDAMIFGMLREDCRWLPRQHPPIPPKGGHDGQHAQAA
jgi:hypothetical protein